MRKLLSRFLGWKSFKYTKEYKLNFQKYEDIEKLSLNELKKEYDNKSQTTQVGLDFIKNEISLREQKESNKQILDYTKQMRNMTIIITILTLINLLCFLK